MPKSGPSCRLFCIPLQFSGLSGESATGKEAAVQKERFFISQGRGTRTSNCSLNQVLPHVARLPPPSFRTTSKYSPRPRFFCIGQRRSKCQPLDTSDRQQTLCVEPVWTHPFLPRLGHTAMDRQLILRTGVPALDTMRRRCAIAAGVLCKKKTAFCSYYLRLYKLTHALA